MEIRPIKKDKKLEIRGINKGKSNSVVKTGKKSEMMRKPLPFNMNFWKNNNNILPNCDKNREKIINASKHSPIILNRPFKKEVIRFHNKNQITSDNTKRSDNYFKIMMQSPFYDGSYDLHKANWDVNKRNRPTEKFHAMKYSNPFAKSNQHRTNFGYVYSAGGIPCRIDHGGVSMKLVWTIPVETLEYDPILITCFEGLLETEHPYNYIGKQCIRDLLNAKGAKEKVLPILGKLITPLKNALKSDIPDIFCEAMNDLILLSNLVKMN